jgi:carbonic anhydrase
MNFLQRLIDCYSAFAGGRLQNEQDRFRELAEGGQTS